MNAKTLAYKPLAISMVLLFAAMMILPGNPADALSVNGAEISDKSNMSTEVPTNTPKTEKQFIQDNTSREVETVSGVPQDPPVMIGTSSEYEFPDDIYVTDIAEYGGEHFRIFAGREAINAYDARILICRDDIECEFVDNLPINPITSNPIQGLSAIKIYNDLDDIYIGATMGIILHSTDQGETWILEIYGENWDDDIKGITKIGGDLYAIEDDGDIIMRQSSGQWVTKAATADLIETEGSNYFVRADSITVDPEDASLALIVIETHEGSEIAVYDTVTEEVSLVDFTESVDLPSHYCKDSVITKANELIIACSSNDAEREENISVVYRKLPTGVWEDLSGGNVLMERPNKIIANPYNADDIVMLTDHNVYTLDLGTNAYSRLVFDLDDNGVPDGLFVGTVLPRLEGTIYSLKNTLGSEYYIVRDGVPRLPDFDFVFIDAEGEELARNDYDYHVGNTIRVNIEMDNTDRDPRYLGYLAVMQVGDEYFSLPSFQSIDEGLDSGNIYVNADDTMQAEIIPAISLEGVEISAPICVDLHFLAIRPDLPTYERLDETGGSDFVSGSFCIQP